MGLVIRENDNGDLFFRITDTRFIRDVRAILENRLVEFNIAKRMILGIKIALEEAIYNALTHAYKGSTRHPLALIKFTIDIKQICITVRDYGSRSDWFLHYAMPSFKTQDELLTEGRRGIVLMNYFMNKVQFSQLKKGGTSVKLIKFLN